MKTRFCIFIHAIITAFVIISIAFMLTRQSPAHLIFQSLFVLILAIIGAVSLSHPDSSFSNPGLLILYGLSLIYTTGIWITEGKLNTLPFTVSFFGFIVSIIQTIRQCPCASKNQVKETAQTNKPIKKQEPEIKEKEEELYIASKTSNRYHKRNCKWALGIPKEKMVFLSTKKEASKKGYIPCRCIKKD